MNVERATLIVEVDLDPVPGFGHEAASWVPMLQGMLDRAAGHYNPKVSLAAAVGGSPETPATTEETKR